MNRKGWGKDEKDVTRKQQKSERGNRHSSMQHHVISALNLLIHLPHQPQVSSGPSAALKTRSRVVSVPSSSFVPFLLPQAPTWALLQVPIWERLCQNSWSPLCSTATINSSQLPAPLPGRESLLSKHHVPTIFLPPSLLLSLRRGLDQDRQREASESRPREGGSRHRTGPG